MEGIFGEEAIWHLYCPSRFSYIPANVLAEGKCIKWHGHWADFKSRASWMCSMEARDMRNWNKQPPVLVLENRIPYIVGGSAYFGGSML